MAGKILVNRAPVMTLWAVIVAERLGYSRAEALSLGKTVTGLNAQAKGRALGIYNAPEQPEAGHKPAALAQGERPEMVTLLDRPVPVVQTAGGLRAVSKGEPVEPAGVERYLEKKFGDRLAEVRAALEELAASYPPDELAARAYALYERFRPEIPAGKAGWGAAGELDLEKIASEKRKK
ncbi:MAG: hypothetical protein ACYC6L_15880 [Anaerolineae bacterium]